MNSSINSYSENDRKILYDYHILALQNGWGLGLRHMEFGIMGDDIAPCHTKSGFIPFHIIYGFHQPRPYFNEDPKWSIVHTGTDTVCNVQGWSNARVIPNTILAKTIVDYIFTYWNNYHINLAIKLAKSGIIELINKKQQSSFNDLDQYLEYNKKIDEEQIKIREEEMKKREEEMKKRQEEMKKREEEMKKREEQIKIREEISG